MNNDWKDFLRSNGAIFDRDTDEQFGTDSAVLHEFTRPVISLVNWMGIARVSGADAQTFLQAQCTGDIGNIEADTSRLSGYCDPKGRLLAIFRVLRDGKDFLLLTDSEILPAIVKRLKMYILRMKVELTLQDSQVVLGIAGPHAQQLAEKLIGKLRLHQNSAEQVYNVTAISTFMPTPRFLIVTNAQQIFAAWSNIRDHAILVGSA